MFYQLRQLFIHPRLAFCFGKNFLPYLGEHRPFQSQFVAPSRISSLALFSATNRDDRIPVNNKIRNERLKQIIIAKTKKGDK